MPEIIIWVSILSLVFLSGFITSSFVHQKEAQEKETTFLPLRECLHDVVLPIPENRLLPLCSDMIVGFCPAMTDEGIPNELTILWYVVNNKIEPILIAEDVDFVKDKLSEVNIPFMAYNPPHSKPWFIYPRHFVYLSNGDIKKDMSGWLEIRKLCVNNLSEAIRGGVVASVIGMESRSSLVIEVGPTFLETIRTSTRPFAGL